MADPLVSVLIPSFNHDAYVGKAIESVLSQTYSRVEVVVNDDGSHDGSHEILREYSRDERVQVFLNDTNRGQSHVLNEAIDAANGEYLAILPSDDWFLPEKLTKQMAAFSRLGRDYGCVYSGGLRYFEDTGETREVAVKKYRGNILRPLLTEPFCVYPASPVFRRECFDSFRFDTKYRAEGESLYVKIATKWKFDFVDEPLVVMRDHSKNTGKNSELMLAENERYWREFFETMDLPKDVSLLKRERLGRLYRTKGLELLVRGGSKRWPGIYLISAVRENPRYVRDKKVLGGLAVSCLPGRLRGLLTLAARRNGSVATDEV